MSALKEQFSKLAHDMFEKIDIDHNDIELNEFVDFYYMEQRRLMEQIEETNQRIDDSKQRYRQIHNKIEDLEPQEKPTSAKTMHKRCLFDDIRIAVVNADEDNKETEPVTEYTSWRELKNMKGVELDNYE